MSDGTDVPSRKPTGIGFTRHSVLVELLRVAYAFGLGATAATIAGLGLYLVDAERLGVPFTAVVLLYVLLPAALYLYDRHHARDLVIADLALRIVRPLAALYHVLRTAGP